MTEQLTPPPANLPAVAVQQPRKFEIVHSDTALFDTAKFEQIARVASGFASSSFLPVSLTTVKDSANKEVELGEKAILANCLIVASLAHDWGTNFMAVAQGISIVYGRPMFEGKLIAAIVERRLGIRLRRTYTGEPGTDSYGIKVWSPEDEALGYDPIDGTVGEWATNEKNGNRKKIWTGANRQKLQLFYMGARVWCRLNAPGLIMGVYGADEMDEEEPPTMLAAPLPISAGFDMATKPSQHVEAVRNAGGVFERLEPDLTPLDKPTAMRLLLDGGIDTAEAAKWLEWCPLGATWPTDDDVIDAFQAWQESEKKIAEHLAKEKAAAVTETKGKKTAKPKSEPKPAALSPQMESALDVAMMTIGELGKALAESGHDTADPTTWLFNKGDAIDKPANDEEGQALLGKMNRWIDNAKVEVAAYAENKAVDDHHRDEEDAAKEVLEADAKAAAGPRDPTPDEILGSLRTVIKVCTDWQNLRTTFVGFTRMKDWQLLGAAHQAQVRVAVWERASALNSISMGDGGDMLADPTEDCFAYRCALEACEDVGAIEHMWEGITGSDDYASRANSDRAKLQEATTARIDLIGGAS